MPPVEIGRFSRKLAQKEDPIVVAGLIDGIKTRGELELLPKGHIRIGLPTYNRLVSFTRSEMEIWPARCFDPQPSPLEAVAPDRLNDFLLDNQWVGIAGKLGLEKVEISPSLSEPKFVELIIAGEHFFIAIEGTETWSMAGFASHVLRKKDGFPLDLGRLRRQVRLTTAALLLLDKEKLSKVKRKGLLTGRYLEYGNQIYDPVLALPDRTFKALGIPLPLNGEMGAEDRGDCLFPLVFGSCSAYEPSRAPFERKFCIQTVLVEMAREKGEPIGGPIEPLVVAWKS